MFLDYFVNMYCLICRRVTRESQFAYIKLMCIGFPISPNNLIYQLLIEIVGLLNELIE